MDSGDINGMFTIVPRVGYHRGMQHNDNPATTSRWAMVPVASVIGGISAGGVMFVAIKLALLTSFTNYILVCLAMGLVAALLCLLVGRALRIPPYYRANKH